MIKRKTILALFLSGISFIGKSQSWSSFGSGIPAWTPTCVVSQEKLYIGTGYYGQCAVAGFPVNGICSFNEISIDSLDHGIYGALQDATWYNGKLIVGGDIQCAGAPPNCVPNTVNIAAWDSTAGWSSITPTGGADNTVLCLEEYNGNLYAGGRFLNVDNVSARRIGKWNGTSWSGVGGGMWGGMDGVYCMAVYHGQLYVGGNFTAAGNSGSLPTNYIARWNGTQWDSVGHGFNGVINALVVDTATDVLYAAGGFTQSGFATAFGVAVWNDSVWTPVGTGLDTLWGTRSLAIFNGELYAGGANVATTSLGDTLNNIYKFNGTKWISVDGGANNTVEQLSVYQGNLYVGGYFSQVGNGISAVHIACYGATCPTSVGITENIPPIPFRMFPNPTKDVLHIESEEPNELIFRIFDGAGKLVTEQTFSKKLEYSTKHLAAGTYFVQISLKDGSRIHSEKLIVN